VITNRRYYTHATDESNDDSIEAMRYLSQPLAGDPAVDHLKRGNGLIVWDHVTTTINSQESEVAGALDSSSCGTVQENVVLEGGLLEVLVAGPLEGLGPGLVSEPVACAVLAILSRGSKWRVRTYRCSPKNQRRSGQGFP
jgi:hypothetical protein